jgi:ABC-type branched-subunit amino acid transport system substrate-binding protein
MGLSALAMLAMAAICAFPDDRGSTIVIAAAGPITGSAAVRGKDLEQAARMAVDEVNAAGGIAGHKVAVDVYDDGDDPARAHDLAVKIAATPALAVLGQVASSAAFAAGQVYKEQQIPAITGAASEGRVTKGNDWFFRLFRDANGQGEFLADYAHYRFGAHSILVIREKGTAGDEFASALRDRAKKQGIRIIADVEFLPADVAALAATADKLAKLPKADIVVLGTQFAETPAVLRTLRDKLGPFTSLGYSSLATDGLNAQFAADQSAHPQQPGYYTENFTVAAPQLGDVAEYDQTVFASLYKARYGADPDPEAVRWYEGAKLIFQAIAATGVTGSETALGRRRIRDWIAGRNSLATAAKGVAGPIYFDSDHNVQRGIAVGVFHDGHLMSAPVQFTSVAEPDEAPGWDELVSKGRVIEIDGKQIVKTPVVYAGMDLNSLDNIDVRAGTFAADFFLWFRYEDSGGSVDPHEVEFPTAVSGAQLGKSVWERKHGGFTAVSYHVKGVFHGDYEFSRFPFDRQTLRIPVQIHNSTSYSLILAYGGSGDAGSHPNSSVVASRLWKLHDALFYRDVASYDASLGEHNSAARSVEVNRINAAVTVERDVFGFAVKNFLPLLCILVAVLVGYSVGPDVINPRVSIGVTALLTTSVLYQKMASDLPTVTYIIAMDYVFFAFFAFCVTFLGLTVVTYETQKEKRAKTTVVLNRSGAGLTLIGLLLTLTFVWMHYWSQV